METHKATAALNPGLEVEPSTAPNTPRRCSHSAKLTDTQLLQKSRVMATLTHQLPASCTMLWPVSTGPGLCTRPMSPTVQSSTQPSGSSWSSDFRVETRRLSQERKEGCTYMAQVSGWWFSILPIVKRNTAFFVV